MAVTKPVPLNPNFLNTRTQHIADMTLSIVNTVSNSEFTGDTTTYGGAIATINQVTKKLTGTDDVAVKYKAFLTALKTKLS